MVFWIIWFAILSGVFVMKVIAAPASVVPDEVVEMQLSPIALIGLAAAAGSMVCRWVIIPAIKSPEAKLPAMVAGLAMAELCGILGMFVVARDQADARSLMFVTSVICIILSAPIYTLNRPSTKSPFHQQ